MEALLLMSLYDNRWFFLGWPKNYFDMHKDVKMSNLCYFMAYAQV